METREDFYQKSKMRALRATARKEKGGLEGHRSIAYLNEHT